MEQKMEFRIQASNPRNNGYFCSEDEKISEAIETIFPMMTEEALLVWNTIYIPLNYKYDISVMIEDILIMLNNLRAKKQGNMSINWASNTFLSKWELQWEENKLLINTNWNMVLGHTEDLLNESNSIRVDKTSFMEEWKKLLEVLVINLKKCNYSVYNLLDLKKLIQEFNSIPKSGILYCNEEYKI